MLSTPSIPGATYTWSGPNSFSSTLQNPSITAAGLNAAGTYSVYATVNGCNSNSATTNVVVVSGPTVTAYPSPKDTVCQGATVTFTATPTNAGSGATYQWLRNGIALPGSNSLSFPISGLYDGDIISFLLTPGNGAACATPVNSNFVKMTVLPYENASLTLIGDTSIWLGLLANFQAINVVGGANPKYQWKVNTQIIVGATSNVWGTTQLNNNDKVCVFMTPDFICSNPAVVTACKTIKVATGIANISNDKLKVYPNPTSEVLYIEGLTKGTRIQLIDILGRVVYSTIGGGMITIPTKQLANGNYVLKLITTDGKSTLVNITKE
jgi:hypothetical protein